MRMWMVKPKIMCRNHLLGEHAEIHMFLGSLKKKKNLSGFFEKKLLEPGSLRERHEELVKEMEKRGYRHFSPLPEFSLSYLPEGERKTKVDKKKSKKELLKRCPECRKRAWL